MVIRVKPVDPRFILNGSVPIDLDSPPLSPIQLILNLNVGRDSMVLLATWQEPVWLTVVALACSLTVSAYAATVFLFAQFETRVLGKDYGGAMAEDALVQQVGAEMRAVRALQHQVRHVLLSRFRAAQPLELSRQDQGPSEASSH